MCQETAWRTIRSALEVRTGSLRSPKHGEDNTEELSEAKASSKRGFGGRKTGDSKLTTLEWGGEDAPDRSVAQQAVYRYKHQVVATCWHIRLET